MGGRKRERDRAAIKAGITKTSRDFVLIGAVCRPGSHYRLRVDGEDGCLFLGVSFGK